MMIVMKAVNMSSSKMSNNIDFSILIVDDNPFIVELLKTFLNRFSPNIIEAENGKLGLDFTSYTSLIL